MGILFVYSLVTILGVLVGFIKTYETNGNVHIPHWFLITISAEVILYSVYYMCRQFISFTNEGASFLLYTFHDIFVFSVIMLITNFEKYVYIATCLLYYNLFFTLIVLKKRDDEDTVNIERASLPRKTFIEMI